MQRGVTNGGSLAADPALEAQIFHFLYSLNVVVVLIGWIKAQDVHVEARALFDEGEADAPGADDGNGFSGDFVAQKRQIRMPVVPAVFSASDVRRARVSGREFPSGRKQIQRSPRSAHRWYS
jgi:hypothetical protein